LAPHTDDVDEDSINKIHGVMYCTTTKHGLESSINKIYSIDNKIFNGTFLDYGSGKGLTLYTAHKLKFNKIIGIEFMQEFYNISILNIKKLLPKQTNIKIIHNDASLYPPPHSLNISYILF